MSVDIAVRGSFSSYQHPERGTVHASVSFEGAAMQPVYERVASTFDAVTSTITPLHDPEHGPVTRWSAQQLRTWSNRPWNNHGDLLPFVHHASVNFEVEFRDFTALSRWVGENTVNTEGFGVARIAWTLTDSRRDEVNAEARTSAVGDAVSRAQQYADALGLGKVRPVAIADPGMLGEAHPQAGLRTAYVDAAPGSAGGAPEVGLVPEDIRVAATVDARFIADA